MGYPVLQSSTAQPLVFFMVDSTDHITGKTGLSPTVTLSKNGGAFAAPAGAVSEIASGWYKVAGNATDSATLGPLLLHATSAGADPSDDQFAVVLYDPQNGASLGLSRLDAAVSSRLATAGYTVPDNTDIAALVASVGTGLHTELDAVKTQTDKFTFTGSNVNAQTSGNVQLAANGLDLILVETGINVRQALAPILAAAAGTLAGATTSTVAIAAALSPTTNRITATVDGSGNRTAVSLNLPA